MTIYSQLSIKSNPLSVSRTVTLSGLQLYRWNVLYLAVIVMRTIILAARRTSIIPCVTYPDMYLYSIANRYLVIKVK